MRTFSKLAPHCSHPEELDVLHVPNPRRTAAADVGTSFHEAAAAWISAHANGEPFFDGAYSPTVRGWLNKLRANWVPPKGIETEVALGLALDSVGEGPVYVEVIEEEPHVYRPTKVSGLLTAGRADWLWPVPDTLCLSVVDVKSGQSYLGTPNTIAQLLAQGFAAALRGGYVSFKPGIYYARLGELDWSEAIPVMDAEAWEIVKSAALRDTEPRTGGHCLACWSKAKCEAYARLIA